MAIFAVDWRQDVDPVCRGGALTIGNFDGVHRGHQALLAELRRQAQAIDGPAVAITFDPPPLAILRPDALQPPLTTLDNKVDLLQRHGADHVVVLRTCADLLKLSAPEFFDRIVCRQLGARALVPGFNFCFGRGREGTVEVLASFCREANLACLPAAPFLEGGEAISSSRVRALLQRGDVRGAARLLGRWFSARGIVVQGKRRGQALGFPTANLERVVTLLPAHGVYAMRVQHEGRSWPGAANIGPNPTFAESANKIEIHLIGYSGDLYGQEFQVEFVERLRDTRGFPDAAALVEQLRVDVEQARTLADCSLNN